MHEESGPTKPGMARGGPRAPRRRHSLPASLALSLLLPALSTPAQALPPDGHRELSLTDRIEAQRAIEEVRWRHRIWPDVNDLPKPALEEVLPPAAIEARVRDGLRKSAALDVFWRQPLTREQLQAEVDRMARDSRDPQALREIFAALHDDPVLIRECLARPILAERLARNWYAFDDRWHQALENRARSGQGESAVRSVEYRRGVPGSPGGADGRSAHGAAVRWLEPNAWRDVVGRLEQARGADFVETAEAFVWKEVAVRADDRLVVRERHWLKRSFESWWAEASLALTVSSDSAPSMVNDPLESASTQAPAAAPEAKAGACNPDTWLSDAGMSGLDPVTDHTAVWTGSEMIVWGGFNGSSTEAGFSYDPSTDVWTRITAAGAPSARAGHTAVWTGTEMIVWGGYLALTDSQLDTGGRYNPVTRSWTETTLVGAPAARSRHTAVWTGTEMIVWGGDSGGGSPTDSGARFAPAAGSWTALPVIDAPAPRWNHTAVWSGTQMIVWGGEDLDGPRNDGRRYVRAGNAWSPMAAAPIDLPARTNHTAVWTGTRMLVWGGNTGLAAPTGSGATYDPALDNWAMLPAAGAPSARWDHAAVWTGTQMIVWGGDVGYATLGDGARYVPGAASWTALPAGDAPDPRARHTAVWAGAEMIVWGGDSGDLPVKTGGRYLPAPDNMWLPTSTLETVPSARWRHTAVWTGAELVVWGGEDGALALQTGGRFDPATASWTPTSVGGAPLPRTAHTAVWTGTEMIVWGGGGAPNGSTLQFDTGARYNPATDTWIDMTLVDAPVGRAHHRAVWTGKHLIVWGGGDYGTTFRNTGGRYDPATDTWAPTSVGPGVPSGRDSHAAVWTGRELIVWGGYDGHGDTDSGGRYDPALDSWTPLPSAGAPLSRFDHSGIWTGRELIVWGGIDYGTASTLNSGARFDPAGGAWSPISAAGAPDGRARHSAVWTGERMIVWGGINQDGALPDGPLHTGGLYDPAANAWTRTSVGTNVPAGRELHTAIWAGSRDGRMFLWGGSPGAASGGIYCGLSCTASPPSGSSVLRVARGAAGEAQISWTPLAGATGHDVARGEIGTLRASGGDFARSMSRCLANDTKGTTTSDGEPPGSGNGFWYLQRGRNCGGAGTYDSGAVPAEGRDREIESSGSACP